MIGFVCYKAMPGDIHKRLCNVRQLHLYTTQCVNGNWCTSQSSLLIGVFGSNFNRVGGIGIESA